MTLLELAREIAVLQAKARCGDSVYMDGSHNPTFRESKEAGWLVDAFAASHPELKEEREVLV